MKDYSIYYSYKNMGDVLVIIFDDEKGTTKTETKGRVTVIYNDSEIIGYNIFNWRSSTRPCARSSAPRANSVPPA